MSKCVSARIEIDSSVGDKMIESYEGMQLSEEHISVPDEVDMSSSRRLIVKTFPQVNCMLIFWNLMLIIEPLNYLSWWLGMPVFNSL